MLREMLVDDIYLLGGQFAILCQFAHPALAKGSHRHSSFATRIAGRLQNTARFLNAAVYGSPREKAAVFSVIHRYHARVKGPGYDADDPELHKWTAATLFVSIVVVHETFFDALPPHRLEALFRQAAVYGTSLRMTPDMWPATLTDFWAYWDRQVATLDVTDDARALAAALLDPRGDTAIPPLMRAAMPLGAMLAAHLLPPRLAEAYGLQPASTLAWVRFRTVVAAVRVAYPLLPTAARQSWHWYYMEDLRQAVERIEKTGHWGRP